MKFFMGILPRLLLISFNSTLFLGSYLPYDVLAMEQQGSGKGQNYSDQSDTDNILNIIENFLKDNDPARAYTYLSDLHQEGKLPSDKIKWDVILNELGDLSKLDPASDKYKDEMILILDGIDNLKKQRKGTDTSSQPRMGLDYTVFEDDSPYVVKEEKKETKGESNKSEEIDHDKILSHPEVLKGIAKKIIKQKNALLAAKDKLIKIHGPESKIYWKSDDKDGIYPYLQDLQTLDPSELKDLNRESRYKTTFFTKKEIDKIINEVIELAIDNGEYGKHIESKGKNPRKGKKSKIVRFSITYPIELGELCIRDKNDSSIRCSKSDHITIIFEAKSFFNAIIRKKDYNAWEKNKQLQGSIVTIH